MSADSRLDLIVLAPDTPEIVLAVEIKLHAPPAAEEALLDLERRLTSIRCPVGVLISWPWTHVLTGPTTPPFQVGYQRTRVQTSALLGLPSPPLTGKEAEAAAFAWLSRLTTATPLALPKEAEAQEVVRDYLMPAAAGGRIYAS